MTSHDGTPSGAKKQPKTIARTVLSLKVDRMGKPKSSHFTTTLCPYCECGLSNKTYKKHRMLYYNETAGVWTKADQYIRRYWLYYSDTHLQNTLAGETVCKEARKQLSNWK